MARVLVLGAYGLLGSVLSPTLEGCGHTVFRQGRTATSEYPADPIEQKDIDRIVGKVAPDVVVNLVAKTNVDACEDDLKNAYQANVRSVETLVSALRGSDCHLVHISTDQVYGGVGPHQEMLVMPCNVYGLTKYAGELVAKEIGATVLRTNYVGRSRVMGRVAFSDWLVESFRAKRRITLFDDVLFNPLHTSDLCNAIELAVTRRVQGVFNVGSSDGLSKARFAIELAQRLGLDTSYITLGKAADIKLRARRPRDMRMNVTQFQKVISLHLPDSAQTLDSVAREYWENANV